MFGDDKIVPFCIVEELRHLILSQDGNQRTRSVWSYTLYDTKNRSIEIGETSTTNLTTDVENYNPTNKSPLQYLYYDNYNYAEVHPFSTSENIAGVDQYNHVVGLQTGAKTKVLGTETWITTTTYYDNKVRPIQIIADIYGVSGGKSYVSTKYDFVGNILQTRERHDNGTATPDIVVATNTYDNRGRLLTTSTSLNGSMPATMAYMYDELGRLSSKKYANSVTETYAYNVRGWLTEKSSSKFNMKLRYQNPAILSTTARFNGNISEWEWKQGATTPQAYTFTYDGLSRLKESKQYAQNGNSWTVNNLFIEKGLTYDQNGNIKTLQRNANGTLTNNLSYTYTGNQLTALSSTTGSYLYDKNGNMTKDARKNLDIEYNSLNLLSEVKVGTVSKAKYVYAADGTKLAVRDGVGIGYNYIGSLIYKSTSGVKSLESAAFSDGRITKTTSGYTANYNLTDHLGSVRVILDGSGNIIEQNDYYPFGGRHLNGSLFATNNRFKYNGKELQTTGDIGYLDYSFRLYDPYLGRLTTQDPLQEDYYSINSYSYCFNDPIRYVDMFGLYPDGPMDMGTVHVKGGGNNPFAMLSVWIKMLEAQKKKDHETLERFREKALDVSAMSLNGSGSRKAFEEYRRLGDIGSFFNLIGNEILGQWQNPRLVINGVLAGTNGYVMINATPKVVKGATGAANAVEAKAAVLSKEELLRIQNAATKIKKPIIVVGSRASGTAGANSDWDYIIDGLNSKSLDKIKNSLPGSKSILDNTPRNIDIIRGPVDTNLPHITINPRKIK